MNVCRLCFVVSDKQMLALVKNHDILFKISSCLSINLIMKDPLPTNVCTDCVTKINDVYEFKKKIKENEERLLQYIENGEPFNFIHKIMNGELKVEVNTPKIASVDIKVTEGEQILPQNCSSDDEDTLLSLKKEKDEENQGNKIHTKQETPDEPMQVTNASSKQFKCLTCFALFESKKELPKHYSSQHGVGKNINSEEYNVVTTDGVVSYKCKNCKRVFKKKKFIVNHMVMHQKLRPYVCNMCGRTYKTIAEIIRHDRVHSTDRLVCPKNCGFSTVYRGAMNTHIKGHSDNPVYKYTCDKCGKGFHVKTWHDQHQNIHTGVKPYVCNICGVSFHMDKYLTSHRSTVHPHTSKVKRYVCVHCQLPCHTRRSLTLHMEVHGIKKRFLCDICGKVLSSGEKLKYHTKIVHLKIKPHTCSQCNKSFPRKFNLALHERTHTGQRDHSCTTCGACFGQRSTLARHNKRFHSDSKS